jgi:hypothetical protein
MIESGVVVINGGDPVHQPQLARLSRCALSNTGSGTLEDTFRAVRGVGESGVDGGGKIELAVAVGVRAREGEERPRRWIQQVGLGCRDVGRSAFESHLEAQLLDGGKCRT